MYNIVYIIDYTLYYIIIWYDIMYYAIYMIIITHKDNK